MTTLSDQQIQIINSNRTAKTTDRYLDTKGNVWVGAVDGRLFVPPFSTELPSSKTDGSLSVEQRLLNLEGRLTSQSEFHINEAEVDLGSSPYKTYWHYTITNSKVTSASSIQCSKAIKSPSNGRDIDEIIAETLEISAAPGNGRFDLYIKSLNGSVTGKFIVNYVF